MKASHLTRLSLLIIIFVSGNLQASAVVATYNNDTLQDKDTGESAEGLHSAGIKGHLFNIVYFGYEQSFNSESLQEYADSTSNIENVSNYLQTGLKILPFLDNKYANKLYVEYQKDVYEISYDTSNKYYVQENVFVGLHNHLEQNDVQLSGGIFLHNNTKEWRHKESGEFISEHTKDVYGLQVRIANLFIPYQAGKPLGLEKYGTGILIDDIQVQYQLTGGDDYFFSTGLGLAHRSKWLNIYAKYVFEITTDTQASKLTAGLGVFF